MRLVPFCLSDCSFKTNQLKQRHTGIAKKTTRLKPCNAACAIVTIQQY